MLTSFSKMRVFRKVRRFKGRERALLTSPALSQRTQGGVQKKDIGWKCRFGLWA